MGVYKHLCQIEEKLYGFYPKYIAALIKFHVGIKELINTHSKNIAKLPLYNTNNYLTSLNKTISRLEDNFSDMKNTLADTKKNITVKNLELCIEDLSILNNVLLASFDILDMIGTYLADIRYSFSDNKINNAFRLLSDNVLNFSVDNRYNNTKLIVPSYLRSVLSTDKKIMQHSMPNSSILNLSGLLEFSHIHTEVVNRDYGNKHITIKFISKINFDKEIYINDTFSETIKTICNVTLQNVSSDVAEEKLFSIKGMTSRELELQTLNLVKKCFLAILDKNSDLVRSNKCIIQVEIMHSTKTELGHYTTGKSNYDMLFIAIRLNDEVLYDLINNNFLDMNGTTARTIIHELGHAYDNILNTRNEQGSNNYKKGEFDVTLEELDGLTTTTARRIVGARPDYRAIVLAGVLIGFRTEGLAMFNESKTAAGTLVYKKQSLMFIPAIIHNHSTYERFRELLNTPEIMTSKAYKENIIHELGNCMATLIFMYDYKNNLSYIRSRTLMKIIIDSRQDSGKILKSVLDVQKNIKPSIDAKDMLLFLNGEEFKLISDTNLMKKLLSAFITKLSLMPPEIFLEEYEKACAYYNIPPIITKKDWSSDTYYPTNNDLYNARSTHF